MRWQASRSGAAKLQMCLCMSVCVWILFKRCATAVSVCRSAVNCFLCAKCVVIVVVCQVLHLLFFHAPHVRIICENRTNNFAVVGRPCNVRMPVWLHKWCGMREFPFVAKALLVNDASTLSQVLWFSHLNRTFHLLTYILYICIHSYAARFDTPKWQCDNVGESKWSV